MASLEGLEIPAELQSLSTLVEEHPETLATGNREIQLAALKATKYLYDLALKSEAQSRGHIAELLLSLSPSRAPRTRSQTAAKSISKQDDSTHCAENGPVFQETPISELVIDDMHEDQIWAQLELRTKNVCEIMRYALEGAFGDIESDEEGAISVAPNGKEIAIDGDIDMDGLGNSDSDSENDDEDISVDSDEEDTESDGEDEDLGEDVVELREEGGVHGDLDLDRPSAGSRSTRDGKRKRRHSGHPQLDDGFFDLSTFNRETEEAEARAVSKGRLGKDDSEDEDEFDEPLDLFAPVDDQDDIDKEDGEPSEPFYRDFFDPPARPSTSAGKSEQQNGKVRFHEEVRVKNIKAKGKNLPTSLLYAEEEEEEEEGVIDGNNDIDDDEEGFGEMMEDLENSEDGGEGISEDESALEGNSDADGQETMERFKDDLFAEEDDKDEQPDMSIHEKRMVILKEEIATLEAENVAKKNWTLMGEATSRSRPQNSLLEEDLEFERVMKSVPVITENTVRSLEERIKARILENQYDDVVRKRPVDDKPFLPSRFFELQDTKSKQSLAEIYEDEYTAAQTGGVAGEDRDGKLRKEHQEIEKLWESITSKLDALCNAHFTPKAPKASISTVGNVAAASMESALPMTMSTSSMLAPEEVFAPPTSADLRARNELTPAEKRALRNKQKKVKKKARDALEKSVDKFAKSRRSVKQQKEAALKSIVKSGKGVTVVGKKGKDIAGKGNKSSRTTLVTVV